MSDQQGVGQFVTWEGGCLMIGRALSVTPMHAHYAMQVAFGSRHGIRFRSHEDEPWAEHAGVVIPSRQPHSMDATPVPSHAVLFVEPETREGRALAELRVRGGITSLAPELLEVAGPALFATWHNRGSHDDLVAASQAVVRALTGGIEPAVVSDERILRAVRYIRTHLDSPLTLEEVASEACLSPSRFRHLFVEQTGVGLRAYVLWRRFIRVWELTMTNSGNLSAAAHAAGFADAAHLTRTCRKMFGFPPSALRPGWPTEPDGAGVRASDGYSPAPSRKPVSTR